MMDRLWSVPPHTLGLVSPACCATLTNCTGDVVGLDTAASTKAGSLHFHRGVVRASVSVLPSMKREEPRKRRRGKIIDCEDYRDSSGWHFGERMSDNARALFDGNDLIDGHISQFVYLPAGPGDHERFDFASLAQAKMDPRIAGRHIACSALRLFHLGKPFRCKFQGGAGAIAVGFRPEQ